VGLIKRIFVKRKVPKLVDSQEKNSEIFMFKPWVSTCHKNLAGF
jgi:hypothetical protein